MIIQQSNFGSNNIIRSGIHEGKYDYGDHVHQYCELVWVLDGEIEMTVEGRCELAKKGDMTVITPFAVHSFHTPEYAKIHIAVISDSFINPSITFEELCAGRTRSVFTMSGALVAFLSEKGYIDGCLHHNQHKNDNNYLHNLRVMIYAVFAEYFNTAPTQRSSGKSRALSKILLYLSAHFAEDLTLETVGAALGYSPKYVSNCIGSLGSISFRTMLNSLRIEAAKNLLIGEPHLTVIDVALRCGFATERSFHRAFRAIVGTTPAKYRKDKLV